MNGESRDEAVINTGERRNEDNAVDYVQLQTSSCESDVWDACDTVPLQPYINAWASIKDSK